MFGREGAFRHADLPGLFERCGGYAQLLFDGFASGGGLRHRGAVLCLDVREVRRGRRLPRCMPLQGVPVRCLGVRQILLESGSRGSFEHEPVLQIGLVLGGGRDRGAQLRFAPGEVAGCGGGLRGPVLVSLIKRGGGGAQLVLEGLARGVGVGDDIVIFCETFGEVCRASRQLRCMALFGILLRGIRGRHLPLEGRARGDCLRDLLFQFRLTLGGEGLVGCETLLVLPVRGFRVAEPLLERAAGRSRFGQHRAKFRFTPGEALGCGGSL